jgi:hypothetical protein
MTDIEQVSKASLQSLKDANFLGSEDLAFIQDNLEFSQEHFEKRQIWRDEVDMRVSVLNDRKHPTKAAKYWQANREYSVFYEQLTMLAFDYQETCIDIEEIENKLTEEDDEFKLKRLGVELQRKLYLKRNQELQSKDRVRELRLWKDIMTELDDGSFNTQDSSDHKALSLVKADLLHVMQVENKQIQLSQGEMANLYGRCQTGLKYAEDKGILEDVVSVLPEASKVPTMGALGYQLTEASDG